MKTNFKVVKVSDKDITMTNPATGEVAVPYGMAVWSTGIGTRPIIMDFMKQVGQVYLVFLFSSRVKIVHVHTKFNINMTFAGESACSSY